MQSPSNGDGPADREAIFHSPFHACFACSDTGVVENGDGLVNEFLPFYDRLADGRRAPGRDHALICHCPAAFASQEGDKVHRAGYRLPDGSIRLVDGRRPVGGEMAKDLTRVLHQRRRNSWLETERQINASRRARASGESEARPWFLEETRAFMQREVTAARLQAELLTQPQACDSDTELSAGGSAAGGSATGGFDPGSPATGGHTIGGPEPIAAALAVIAQAIDPVMGADQDHQLSA